MEVQTQKLLDRLRDIKQLTRQTEQGIVSNVEVQRTHPERLKNVETWLKLASDEIGLIGVEDEVGVAHWDEISDALPMVIDRLNNQMTVQKNLDFIMATDKVILKRFIGYVLQYGAPIFQDVLERMEDKDFAAIEDLVDMARRNRV